ncbi:MAG TPA: hypothetical protein VG297_07415 [Bryobacteraceae bacterium]|jgi:hypothetical protein|nr:hypothetical protein [Bryobacteraceae bacterium]
MLEKVSFQLGDYAAEISGILASAGGGFHPMPLVKNSASPANAVREVERLRNASAPVRAALYLYLGCWDEAHNTADSVENPDGYFWHAIVHRQEPDAANAGYWFRKTGRHPIFPKLAAEAESAGYHSGSEWDPYRFVDFCGNVRARSAEERLALEVQLIEWQLLFDFCTQANRGQRF